MSLVVLVDLLLDFDRFVDAGRLRADQFGGSVVVATLYSILDYYYPVTLLAFVFLSGLLVVAAMGFTLWGMGKAGELVALIAGGVSLYRVAAPVLVAGCLVNLLAMPMQEYLIPALADKLARGKGQVGADTISTFDVRLAVDGRGNLFSAKTFDPKTQTMQNLTILERDPASGRVLRCITAGGAQWDGTRWRLSAGQTVTRSGGGEARPRALLPIAAYETDLSPKLLLARRATIYPRLLSLGELREMAANPAADQALLTQIMQSRFSLMVVNVLILVMALPFFLLREPANRMVQAVQAAGLVLGAWGLALVVMQVNTGLLGNPYTAAWLPVVIYLPVSALLLQRVRT